MERLHIVCGTYGGPAVQKTACPHIRADFPYASEGRGISRTDLRPPAYSERKSGFKFSRNS